MALRVCNNLLCSFFIMALNCVKIANRVFHLRTTILPAEEDMPDIMASFKKFNDEFMEQYEDHRGYSRI